MTLGPDYRPGPEPHVRVDGQSVSRGRDRWSQRRRGNQEERRILVEVLSKLGTSGPMKGQSVSG